MNNNEKGDNDPSGQMSKQVSRSPRCSDEQPRKIESFTFISLLDDSDDENNHDEKNNHNAAPAKPNDHISETIEILDDSDDEYAQRKPAAKDIQSRPKSELRLHSKVRARKALTKTKRETPPAAKKDPPGVKVNPEVGLTTTSNASLVPASVTVVSSKSPTNSSPVGNDSSQIPSTDKRAKEVVFTTQVTVSPLKRAARVAPGDHKESIRKVCRCSGCTKKGPCRQCIWCIEGGGKPCALSFCSLGPSANKQSYLKAIEETRANYRPTFRDGDPVFCPCPENSGVRQEASFVVSPPHHNSYQQRYEPARILNRSGCFLTVVFDASMLRKRVRASLTQDVFLATLDKERARLEGGDTYTPPGDTDQPNISSKGAMGATTRKPNDKPKHTKGKKVSAAKKKGSPTLSDSYGVGARVLARFPLQGNDKDYFWGKIVEVNGNQKYYSVLFDDGDFRPKGAFLHPPLCTCLTHHFAVPRKEVMTEQMFYDQFGKLPPPIQDEADNQAITYEDILDARCNRCSMCKLPDCGSCASCMLNKISSGTKRRECVLRGCENIDASRRSQPLTDDNPAIEFYFSTKKPKDSCPRSLCFCKRRAQLGGVSLRIITPTGRSGCLYEALRKLGWTTDTLKQRIPQIWADIVKSEMTESVAHFLVGKGYYLEWTTCKGLKRSAVGKFSRCLKQMSDESMSFDVEISRSPIEAFCDCGGGRRIVDSHSVCLEEAWGAHIAYKEKFGPPTDSNHEVPFHYKWVNPEWREEVVNEDSSTSIFLIVNGFALEMTSKQSLVPNAGRGLFLTCHALPGRSQNSFVLPVGHLIDLGVYAPHTVTDLKSPALWTVKNLLFAGASECWGFDPPESERRNGFIFEVSDDLIGDVHEVAQRSMVVFANETCGKDEIPSIATGYDPAGAVHYLLGHKELQHGPVEFSLDVEIELKIDYGPNYERERVRKGYPRSTGEELKGYQNLLRKDDEESVKNILTFTADDCAESIEYLSQVGKSHPSPSNEFRYRFLLALLSLGECMTNMLQVFSGNAIKENRFCVNGFDQRFKSITVSSFIRLLDWTCFHLWNDDYSFCASISDHQLLLEKALFFSHQQTSEWSRPMLIEKVKNTLLPLR